MDGPLAPLEIQPEKEREGMLPGHNFILLPNCAPQIVQIFLGEVNLAAVQNLKVKFRKTR